MMLLLVLAGALLLLLGPRPRVQADDGRVRIRYWEKFTGIEGEQMRQIVEDFNRTVGKQKGIFVEYVSMSQIDRKTLVSTAAGVPPDVAGLWDVQVRQFAAMDALEPLDALAAEHGLTRDRYKPVFYDGCSFDGRLVALPSTPWAVALLWDKQQFAGHADALRAAGLDPDRPPRTLAELDRYAQALDTWSESGGRRRIVSAGYIPMEPGWWINLTVYWFGGSVSNPEGTVLKLDTPEVLAAYEWIRGYSERLGEASMTEFRSGFGGFASPQNPFLTGTVAMVQQGPWMANFIEKLNPAMNRWGMTSEQVARDEAMNAVAAGATRDALVQTFGEPREEGAVARFPGTRQDLVVRFAAGVAQEARVELTPPQQRRRYTRWGAAAFPSAVEGLEHVTYGGTDVLVIPRGSRHKREAFEFIAYVNSQPVTEKLNSLHCKISPLREVSEAFYRYHPNPYIAVFDELAASPNARPLPTLPNWPEIADEMQVIAEQVNLQAGPTEAIIAAQAARAEAKLAEKLEMIEVRRRRAQPETLP
jgi:ABC-type glycerol-3-phosphate transport system substrate-binding protein